ncbi:MAG: aminotransferase class V-fold PLP-dependent enzyme [Actinomycetota bacterium]|nr:aminotransferase class V-fold PLP-dependent enzyme [Actinomycetota bacterium]
MGLPEHGMAADDVIAALAAKRGRDARWRDGRTFGLVFDGGPGVHDVAERAAELFLHENALNTAAFPSLAEIQSEVVGACADLFHAPEGAAGFMTSGGTESILLAVKAARERGRAERGVTEPEMVLPESAHAAFHKAASYFGVPARKVAVRPDWRADVDAMAAAVTDNTVLVVGSAPQYPQGVIDPIPEIAELAATVGASMHVDACMGGFVLPFMELNGETVAPWDFRVDGVTTLSADIHKLGYAPKGASVLMHRTKELRRYQTFVFDDWLGGMYASPNMQGTRSSLPMATAWAVMHHLGINGYRERVAATIDAARRIGAGVRAIDGLTVLGEPDAHCLAIGSAGTDVYAVGDALLQREWLVDRQGPPDSLHMTVSAGNVPVVDEFLADLRASVGEVAGTHTDDRSTNYATLE